MDTAQCYRLLELKATANLEEVKASYRRLARRWHPDINPDSQQAHDMFIKVTQAYKVLLKVIPPVAQPIVQPATVQTSRSPATVQTPVKVTVTATRSQQPTRQPVTVPRKTAPKPVEPTAQPASPQLSEADNKLKIGSYRQLQDLIKRQRLPRAVALVEALGNRWPQDLEVRQWRAIVYQLLAKQLIRERKLNQARAYLKKALNTDPHNRSLWAEVERDFRILEQVL
ncbi:Chaperone protein DnaJ [Acaryochloris thomasi RCC1774]|uniref:Chaperone protein DnaJ n=1 Tax=Acaryochloris thomasi RCC1774 TaxID=1764569 RepID=A0A2W1K1D2_9CYAN|nr:J domain-containing protein [Acaryochloris thomasi]PZD75274.1 Chaperone protein DnaJ [Acaryochloris thomasi RCC1774]